MCVQVFLSGDVSAALLEAAPQAAGGKLPRLLKSKAPGRGRRKVRVRLCLPTSKFQQQQQQHRACAEDQSARAEQAKGVMVAAPSCQLESGSSSSSIEPALNNTLPGQDMCKTGLQRRLAACSSSSSRLVSQCPGVADARRECGGLWL